MGGNALKNTKTRRYQADEYERAFIELSYRLMKVCEYVNLVPSYREKKSFGDMDLVVVMNYDEKDVVAAVKRLFNPNEIVKNGNVVSFDYNELQVDLLVQPDVETAKFASRYFAYNDLGNFIGRTANRLGFKLGHDGLKYVVRDPEDDSRVVKELLVTLDFDDALWFLGYDFEDHVFGFDTKEEIFEYAASSKYFDPAQYLLENRPSKARRRDRTRAMYQDALEYFKVKYNLQPGTPKKPVNRQEHLERAFNAFPEFKQAYDEALAAHNLEKAFRKNFNGDNFSKYFGVEGKELGEMMSKYRRYFERMNLKEFVASLSPESFRGLVMALRDEVEK